MGASIDLKQISQKIPHEDAQFHQGTIADMLGRRSLGFPGAQPVSFARKHFAELTRADYYMCEKTDGIRCLLYLTKFVDQDQEAQFLIDRKNDYHYIERDAMHLPTQQNPFDCHTATLLDGELVRQRSPDGSERLMYLIFDCLCLDGTNITHRSYDIRLGKLDAFIFRPWLKFKERYPQDVASQPFQLSMKKNQTAYAAVMMFRDIIPTLPHGNDGLIFTCKSTPYVAGTDQHILKWKPPQENTIDFRLQIGAFPMAEDDNGPYEDWDAKPELNLLVNHGRDGYRKFSQLYLTDKEWEVFKSINQQLDGRIIECYRDPDTGAWRPKLEHDDGTPRFRDDKTDANHISVVQSVLESIEDAVTEDDLIQHAGRIKEAWKEREAMEKKRRDEEKRRAYDADQAKRRAQSQVQQHQHKAGLPPPDDDGPRYED